MGSEDPMKEARLGLRIPLPIRYAVDDITEHNHRKGLQFRGAKLSKEAIASAIFLHFQTLSESEQASILKDYVRKLEKLVGYEGGDDPEPPRARAKPEQTDRKNGRGRRQA